jgi:alanine dehydrogenase
MTKIGIVREGKIPVDKRVPITPEQGVQIKQDYEGVDVVCQPSPHRCYSDSEYSEHGINLQEDLSDCDIIVGVKEVPVESLIPDKTYFFFSHTIKAQPYNQILLQTVLEKNIRLIDYELLYGQDSKRVVAFGRYAGIVGAYNAIWTFGKRYNLFHLKRAFECRDMEELISEYKKVKLPSVRIIVTGGGRVGKGSIEVLYGMGLRNVSPRDLRKGHFKEPVFAQLNSRDYYQRKDESEFSRSEFHQHPEKYSSDFLKYAKTADILIAGAYWDPRAPKLFERTDMMKRSFHLRVIADITCDINGSIPSTKKPTTIEDPVYDYHPSDDTLENAFSDEANISVMAVDNLPCELPRDASRDFGQDLITHCLPNLLVEDSFGMIENAVITSGGNLTKKFSYLQDFADGILND